MAYGSRNKLATATLNSLGGRGSVGQGVESFASRRFHNDHFVLAGSALEGIKMGAPALSAEIGNKIGKQLREIYDFVLREPLPDQFSELLNELEHARATNYP